MNITMVEQDGNILCGMGLDIGGVCWEFLSKVHGSKDILI